MLMLDWKKSAGAEEDFWEFLDFDVDHLTKNTVMKVVRSDTVLRTGESTKWVVKCSCKEDDGGHRIKVRYAEKDQSNKLRSWLRERADRDYLCGTTTIFVEKDPQTGKAKKTGRFEWDAEAEDGWMEGQWEVSAVDGPRETVDRKQSKRDCRLRACVLAMDEKCVIQRARKFPRCWMRRTLLR